MRWCELGLGSGERRLLTAEVLPLETRHCGLRVVTTAQAASMIVFF